MSIKETTTTLDLDFSKLRRIITARHEVIPAVTQEINTREVLIVGYVNQAALAHALREGVVTFWSTSRDELWVKGETSGNTLRLKETRVNCEQNSILYLAELEGIGACHVNDRAGNPRESCFYRRIQPRKGLEFINS